MRPIHLSDLHHAACALRGCCPKEQIKQIVASIAAASTADYYRKTMQKSHPSLGHGTLSSTFGPVQEPQHCDGDYLRAMQIVVTALLQRTGP